MGFRIAGRRISTRGAAGLALAVLTALLVACGPASGPDRKGGGFAFLDIFHSAGFFATLLGPTVYALHAPFYPSGTDKVTFSATGHSPSGVSEITIWQVKVTYDQTYCCVAGSTVTLPSFTKTALKTCPYDGLAQDPAPCEVTAGPFGDGAFVQYGATVKDRYGIVGKDMWIGFAVGKQKDPNQPIPVYTRGDAAGRINIVLVPVGYIIGLPSGQVIDNYPAFVADARKLVVSGYFPQPQIGEHREKWNIYINPVRGSLDKYNSASLSNWTQVAAVANAVGYVHNNASWRDRANHNDSGPSNFTIQMANPPIIAHETGHAIFGLSDEYCCDGGIITTSWPNANTFATQADCQSDALTRNVPTSACVQLEPPAGGKPDSSRACGGTDSANKLILGGTTGFWVQDPAADVMSCGAYGDVPGGPLDIARMLWFYARL